MNRDHDPQSGLHVEASASADVLPDDVVSGVLRAVRLTGAVFFLTEASAPWTIELPDGAMLAPAILPSAQRVISYHVVTRGRGWGGLLGSTPVPLAAGDVILFPHGDPYVMSTAPDVPGGSAREEVLAFFHELAEGRAPAIVRDGGGGERLELICGFLGCDTHPFNPLLLALPRMLLARAAFGGGEPLDHLLSLTLAEFRDDRAGGDCVRVRLSELLFIEVLRRHLATLPPGERGWLAGLRDATVGRTIALLHARPAEPWTLAAIAREIGVSRSALAERFTHVVGQPPMQYLAGWRMQLAARLLADGVKVSAVAQDVGYESEAAFSRAFKRCTGVPPAAWRARGGRAGARG